MSKPIRRHNRIYSGGWPLPTGDRYYAQDILRDQAYLESLTGIAYNDLTQQTAPYVINGLVAAQGAGHTMDISAGKAVVPFEVTLPSTVAAWTVPPTTVTANIDMILDYAGGAGISLASTVTDGATPNYVKLAYTETNGNTRTRVKKAGAYAYEVYDSVTVTIDDTAAAATEITLLTFTTDGATVTVTDNGDTRIGSAFHMQDAVVYDQTSFNDCIIRVAANQYKIRDDIASLYCATLSGGYLMTGGTSPLAGGDTWGVIETNNCKQIIFESGASIHMGNERSYLEIDTDDCYLKNVNIVGTGTVASAIAQSFLLNANRAEFVGCKSSDRLSNVAFYCFRGSGTAAHNTSSKYIDCVVDTIESSNDIAGYYKCYNGANLTLKTVSSSAGNGRGFYDCHMLVNCYASILDGTLAQAFINCDDIANCVAIAIDSTGAVIGFSGCDNIDNCTAEDIDSSGGTAYGFNGCDRVSNSYANQIDHSGAVGGADAYGFYTCSNLSNCKAEDIDTNGAAGTYNGFDTCDQLSNCYATDCENGFDTCLMIGSSLAETCVLGFHDCDYLSSCQALTNTGNGFEDCNSVSVSMALSNGADGFNGCYRCLGSMSSSNTGDGFQDCNNCGNCRSVGNGAAAYNNCFADFGATQAVADTAAGGWNA